jgi:transposase
MAYGQAMRQRVLQDYDEGKNTAAIARRYRVSPAYCRRVKQNRYVPARKPTGRPMKLAAAACGQLTARVAEQPDATLEELRAWCASKLGITVSTGALWSTLRRLKLTLKKSH